MSNDLEEEHLKAESMNIPFEDIVQTAVFRERAARAKWKDYDVREIDWADKDDPIVHIREEVSNRIIDQVARQQDSIIIGALVPHLGPIVAMEILLGQLKSFARAPTEYEDWELDGKPVLRIWPPEIKWEDSGVSVVQKFMRFDKNGELVP